eukprot:TRINITY_DN49510_c0_g1_i1.p1 TRINITY_DN49510_c0_g1~~TRINITY_DN49510_c0_g1_i1.p1  ORF type:complete len:413 (+),score=61.95 TRINITY_DN49510_c0_g1_i1:79-1317(+)
MLLLAGACRLPWPVFVVGGIRRGGLASLVFMLASWSAVIVGASFPRAAKRFALDHSFLQYSTRVKPVRLASDHGDFVNSRLALPKHQVTSSRAVATASNFSFDDALSDLVAFPENVSVVVPKIIGKNASSRLSVYEMMRKETHPANGLLPLEGHIISHAERLQGHINIRKKSKLVLLLIEVSFCGIFGVDRMYSDQFVAGFIKLVGSLFSIVLGIITWRNPWQMTQCFDNVSLVIVAFIVWDLIDYVSVLHACLMKSDNINMLGFRIRFSDGLFDNQTAFIFSAFIILGSVFCMPCYIAIFRFNARSRPTEFRRAEVDLSDENIEVLKKNRHVAKALSHSRNDTCKVECKEACPICLEAITEGQSMQTLACFHSLHHSCAVFYFRQARENAACPVCRMPVGPAEDAPLATTD